MFLRKIKLKAYPNQILLFLNKGDRYTVELHTRRGQLYASVSSEKEGVIVKNRLCLNLTPITKNLMFIDENGEDNPVYSGLNSRFFLVWFEL